jgi:hypothetical protein
MGILLEQLRPSRAETKFPKEKVMKKFLYSSLFICLLFFGLGTACTNILNPKNVIPTATIVSTATNERLAEEYIVAFERWQSHDIKDYEITLDVFSSVLAPACQMKSTLKVEDDTLVHVVELITPEPYQLPNSETILNPECSEYDRYRITSLFDLVGTILGGEYMLGRHIQDARFNLEYGYITYLYIVGGNSVLEIKTSDFSFEP